MAIDRALLEAYRNAEYMVNTEPDFLMYVNTYSAHLYSLMLENQSIQAAFISAYNPYSERLSEH